MRLKVFKHITKEIKTTKEWAYELGITSKGFLYRCKTLGENNIKTYRPIEKRNKRFYTKKEIVLTHPETKEKGNLYYWADKLNIKVETLMKRISTFGIHSKKLYKPNKHTEGNAEWRSFKDK